MTLMQWPLEAAQVYDINSFRWLELLLHNEPFCFSLYNKLHPLQLSLFVFLWSLSASKLQTWSKLVFEVASKIIVTGGKKMLSNVLSNSHQNTLDPLRDARYLSIVSLSLGWVSNREVESSREVQPPAFALHVWCHCWDWMGFIKPGSLLQGWSKQHHSRGKHISMGMMRAVG